MCGWYPRAYKHGCGAWSVGNQVTDPELTEAMIAAAMAKAESRVCNGTARCSPFPNRLEDARKT